MIDKFIFVALIFLATIGNAKAEPSVTPGHQKMLTLLQQIADTTSEENVYIGDGIARQLRAQLAATPTDTMDANQWLLRMQVAEAELCLGNEAEAIRSIYTSPSTTDPIKS